MKLAIEYLSISLTDRCNSCCDHCLRGEPVDRDARKADIELLLSRVSSLHALCLTGGEPTLVPELVEWVAECISNFGIELHEFIIYVNGMEIPEEFALAVTKLQAVTQPEDEYSFCGVQVSHSPWHPKLTFQQEIDFKRYGYAYRDVEATPRDARGMKDQGRASGWGLVRLEPDWLKWNERDGVVRVFDGWVFMSTTGRIVPGCDFSIENQENYHMCSVDEFTAEWVRENLEEENEE